MEPSPRPRPLLTVAVRTWEEQAQLALELLITALEQLHAQRQADASFPVDEDKVSIELALHLNHLIDQYGHSRGVPWLPRPNCDGILGRDPLYTGSREHEEKRPDIRFDIRDLQETTVGMNHKSLVIECKRLGLSVAGHSLSKAYVFEGIVRFCRQSHRYGVYSAWSVMIGYVQSSDHNSILQKVNTHAQNAGIPTLRCSDANWQPITSCLEHTFGRPFPVTPFRLLHLWIDLR
jgi:hypothetical protein